jgi:hypothetical protein
MCEVRVVACVATMAVLSDGLVASRPWLRRASELLRLVLRLRWSRSCYGLLRVFICAAYDDLQGGPLAMIFLGAGLALILFRARHQSRSCLLLHEESLVWRWPA